MGPTHQASCGKHRKQGLAYLPFGDEHSQATSWTPGLTVSPPKVKRLFKTPTASLGVEKTATEALGTHTPRCLGEPSLLLCTKALAILGWPALQISALGTHSQKLEEVTMLGSLHSQVLSPGRGSGHVRSPLWAHWLGLQEKWE